MRVAIFYVRAAWQRQTDFFWSPSFAALSLIKATDNSGFLLLTPCFSVYWDGGKWSDTATNGQFLWTSNDARTICKIESIRGSRLKELINHFWLHFLPLIRMRSSITELLFSIKAASGHFRFYSEILQNFMLNVAKRKWQVHIEHKFPPPEVKACKFSWKKAMNPLPANEMNVHSLFTARILFTTLKMSVDNEAEWVRRKNALWFNYKHSQFFYPHPRLSTSNEKLTWLLIVKMLSSLPPLRSSKLFWRMFLRFITIS